MRAFVEERCSFRKDRPCLDSQLSLLSIIRTVNNGGKALFAYLRAERDKGILCPQQFLIYLLKGLAQAKIIKKSVIILAS